MSYAALRQAHIAQRKTRLASVLDVEEVRGVPLPELLAGGAALFADHGQMARDDPVGTFAKSQPATSLEYSRLPQPNTKERD